MSGTTVFFLIKMFIKKNEIHSQISFFFNKKIVIFYKNDPARSADVFFYKKFDFFYKKSWIRFLIFSDDNFELQIALKMKETDTRGA